jgi:hypothetical protein
MDSPTNTTSSPTGFQGLPGADSSQLPPLAHYRTRDKYVPQYGDYVVWSRWVSCWHGVVKFYDEEKDELHVIFAGVPALLFTLSEAEQDKETTKLKLSEFRGARNGKYAVLQHDYQQNASIWYI